MEKGILAKEFVLFYATLFCCVPHEAATAGSAGAPRVKRDDLELQIGKQRFVCDPSSARELQRLDRDLAAMLGKPDSLVPVRAEDSAALPSASVTTTRRQRSDAKRLRRGLEEINKEIAALESASAPDRSNSLRTALLETVAAVNNSQRAPLPKVIDTVEFPWLFITHVHNPVGRGHSPATNLEPGPSSDLSRLNPLASTFWRLPDRIGDQDLYHGFGRTELPQLESRIFEYARAKDSYGLNPGYEIAGNGHHFKIKFGEVSSEPFVARIFDAVGFHADPTDYSPEVKVRYDRRILQEFNSRQEMKTRFTVLGFIKGYTLELQKRFDPFDYIAWAMMHDGTRWSGAQLKHRLFREPGIAHPENVDGNFRPEVEAQIDYLITVPANVQERQRHLKNIGPWDFAQLDHPDRRELRGAGLLAAWLGWFDTRFDNTRLRVLDTSGQQELVHYFSDLGGALGETGGLLYSRGEQPNAFPWTFTRAPLWQGPHHLAIPLRFEGYRPIARTASFAAMTLDDARWMARLIGQLTEAQIIQALVASGYDSAVACLYTEKLISRRDRMIVDLGLSDEIALLRPAGANQKFSYDPALNGPILASIPGEQPRLAPVTGSRIVEGKLVPVGGAILPVVANSIPEHARSHGPERDRRGL